MTVSSIFLSFVFGSLHFILFVGLWFLFSSLCFCCFRLIFPFVCGFFFLSITVLSHSLLVIVCCGGCICVVVVVGDLPMLLRLLMLVRMLHLLPWDLLRGRGVFCHGVS